MLEKKMGWVELAWRMQGASKLLPRRFCCCVHTDKIHHLHAPMWLITEEAAILCTRRVTHVFSFVRVLTQDMYCFKFTANCIDYILKTSRYRWIILSKKTWLLNYMTTYRPTRNIKGLHSVQSRRCGTDKFCDENCFRLCHESLY